MIPHLRKSFNSSWTPENYRRFQRRVEELCGCPVGFRLSETPCFLPRSLLDQLAAAGAELIGQLSTREYHSISDRSVPAQYNVPREASHPMFVQVDFGLVRNTAGRLDAKLVEIQGFPSLYGFQTVLAQSYLETYRLDGLRYLLGNDTLEDYHRLLRRVIVGNHDPAEVVLLELEPDEQKTLPDFRMTESITGVRPVCLTRVRQQGKRLYARDRPIRRIYNRAIVDELERKGVRAPFDWRDDLDVEWAGHPNYYFRISKFSIPYLKHSTVPRTWFLHEIPEVPSDLENFVLKPLYSFAGLGVVIGPRREEIDRIQDKENWILQERLDFEPVIETPHGRTKVEIRMMYIWPEDAPLQAVCTILRTGRGKMMGVDHNKDMEWVGASAALYEA